MGSWYWYVVAITAFVGITFFGSQFVAWFGFDKETEAQAFKMARFILEIGGLLVLLLALAVIDILNAIKDLKNKK